MSKSLEFSIFFAILLSSTSSNRGGGSFQKPNLVDKSKLNERFKLMGNKWTQPGNSPRAYSLPLIPALCVFFVIDWEMSAVAGVIGRVPPLFKTVDGNKCNVQFVATDTIFQVN